MRHYFAVPVNITWIDEACHLIQTVRELAKLATVLAQMATGLSTQLRVDPRAQMRLIDCLNT